MYEYIVPQELNISDRIGSFTLSQWAFLASGGLISIIFFITESIPLILSIFLGILIMGTAFYLSVIEKHGMPVYQYIFTVVAYKMKPKKMMYSSVEVIKMKDEDQKEEDIQIVIY